MKSNEHLKSSEPVKPSMMIMIMNDGDDDDDTRPLSGRMSESIKLYAHIGPASKTRKCTMSESAVLLTQITTEMKTPRCGMPDSIELYAQIGPASKTRKCPMPESAELLTQIADDMKTS